MSNERGHFPRTTTTPDALIASTESEKYIFELIQKSAELIEKYADKSRLRDALYDFASETPFSKRIQNAIEGYEELYVSHRITAEDIARVFCYPEITSESLKTVHATRKDLMNLKGAHLLLRILDGRDAAAPQRIGLWDISDDGRYALLQHYHPQNIQDRGRRMKNCMQGVTSVFDPKHYKKMIRYTRSYDTSGNKKSPDSMLLTLNILPSSPWIDKDHKNEVDAKTLFDSAPIIMIELDPVYHRLRQMRGMANTTLGPDLFLPARSSYVSDQTAQPKDIGMFLKRLLQLDPFLKFSDMTIAMSDSLKDSFIRTDGVVCHFGSLYPQALPSPQEVLYGGTLEITPVVPLENFDILSRIYGLTLDMSKATPEQKAALHVFRGDIKDTSDSPYYPNLIQMRSLLLRTKTALSASAPQLATNATKHKIPFATSGESYYGYELIPMALAIEQNQLLDR